MRPNAEDAFGLLILLVNFFMIAIHGAFHTYYGYNFGLSTDEKNYTEYIIVLAKHYHICPYDLSNGTDEAERTAVT